MLWIGVVISFAGYHLQGAAPGPDSSRSPKITFRQVYFSTRSEARQALRKSVADPDSISTAADGRPAELASYYPARTVDQIADVFGAKFAEALLQLKPGAWRGPIKSNYGWHVVWIE